VKRTGVKYTSMVLSAALTVWGLCDAQEQNSMPPAILNALSIPMDADGRPDMNAVEIKMFHVAGNVYMLVGGGGNMAVSVGTDGVFLVDDQFAPMTNKIVVAIREISDKPIHFVVNTHLHGDHTGGNEKLGQMGAIIFAHNNVRARMVESDTPAGGLPVVTFSGETTFHFNDEDVVLIPVGAAHTDGDSFVYFTGSNVIHTGDVYVTTSFPIADTSSGGSMLGHIEALNHLIDLAETAPGFLSGRGNAPGAWPDRPIGVLGRAHGNTDTMIIPGHGRLSDEADVVYYRDMLVIIRDRVANLVEKGMTLEEVLAARPAFGWEGRYGFDSGFLSTARFIETLYRELAAARYVYGQTWGSKEFSDKVRIQDRHTQTYILSYRYCLKRLYKIGISLQKRPGPDVYEVQHFLVVNPLWAQIDGPCGVLS